MFGLRFFNFAKLVEAIVEEVKLDILILLKIFSKPFQNGFVLVDSD